MPVCPQSLSTNLNLRECIACTALATPRLRIPTSSSSERKWVRTPLPKRRMLGFPRMRKGRTALIRLRCFSVGNLGGFGGFESPGRGGRRGSRRFGRLCRSVVYHGPRSPCVYHYRDDHALEMSRKRRSASSDSISTSLRHPWHTQGVKQ